MFRRTALILLSCLALAAAAPRPRLVVVISVDQLASELLASHAPDLPGGLGRLWRESAGWPRAMHAHGYTETAPGHSVLLTGRHPAATGIVANRWRDKATGKVVYAVEDPSGPLFGNPKLTRGPANLCAATLGEWLRAAIPGSRMFAFTGKDRSAIPMAGRGAQGVYWFEDNLLFTTSAAFAGAAPAWLEAFDQSLRPSLDPVPAPWTPLRSEGLPPGGTYQVLQRTFVAGLPRDFGAAGEARTTAWWDRLKASPWFDDAILQGAGHLLKAERLGQGPGVDVLALGLSATDYIGHRYGNGGPEMVDHLRRLDLRLGTFLDAVEAQAPGAWVVLTADHGCKDMPERLQQQGKRALRLDQKLWRRTFEAAVNQRLGGDRKWLLAPQGPSYSFDRAVLQAAGRSAEESAREAAAVALGQPHVAAAFTAGELAGHTPSAAADSLKDKLALSFHPERSGDLMLAFDEEVMFDGPIDVAFHGSPYTCDQQVPMLFRGPWKAGARPGAARTVDLAPTLASLLGIRPLGTVDGRVLDLGRPVKTAKGTSRARQPKATPSSK